MLETIANEFGKYAAAGVAVSMADTITSLGAKGLLKKSGEQRERYDAMSLVNEAYSAKDFAELKKDPVFREAFLVTQEYFRNHPTPALETKVAAEEPKFKKLAAKKEEKGKYFTWDYWKNFATEEKLSRLSFRQLLVAGATLPLAFDAYYIFGGAQYGTSSFSEGLGEVAQSPLEAAGFILGLYAGRAVSAPIKAFTNRYDKKIAKVERDIRSNDDLVKALGEEIVTAQVVVPAVTQASAAVAGEYAGEPVQTRGKAAAPHVDPAEQFTQANESLVERMRRISGVNQ